jgi:hypothetical protein
MARARNAECNTVPETYLGDFALTWPLSKDTGSDPPTGFEPVFESTLPSYARR